MLSVLLTIFGILLLVGIPIIIYIKKSKKYNCVNNDCIQDNSGSFKSLQDCKISCSDPPSPTKKYKCKSGNCIEDPLGNYNSLDQCKSKCKEYLTFNNYKLNGTQYKTFTGTNAFQDAKDFCSNDINCKGINGISNSASVVKEPTQVSSLDGSNIYTSIIPSSKGKYITPIGKNALLTGTEYKETTQFTMGDMDKIMKYCRDDKDAEGYNLKLSGLMLVVTLVKNVTGAKDHDGFNWFGVKWG